MKKRIGDVQYYLEKENEVFYFVKRIKAFSNKLTEGKKKATTITVSDFCFTKNNFDNINFNENGLREKDKDVIIKMVSEMDGKDEN